MKRVISTTIVALLLLGFLPGNILVGQSKKPYEDPKYGQDSASRMECIKNLSLYSEFYKQKNYSDAFGPWSIAVQTCPASSKNLYIHGDKLLKIKIKKEKDKAAREIWIDSLLNLYDQRIEYFGQEGFVTGRKGNALMSYRPSSFEEAHTYFERSFELKGVKTEAQILVLYMQTTDVLYKSEKIGKEKVVDNYAKISDAINAKVKKSGKESDIKAKNNIDIIFDQGGAATCESLISLYTGRFEENPEDLELLKKVTTMLDKYECTDSKLFAETSEKLHSLEPSAQAAYMLAKLFLKRQVYDKASAYYKEAIELQTDSIEKGRYYYQLGVLTHSQQSSPELARTYAYNALKFNPKDGKPYILIGNIYAASAKDCGENDFEKSAVYWVVVDKFKTAKRIDTSLVEEANKLIDTYSKYYPDKETSFFHEAHEGEEHKVGCWINETTKIRF